MFSYFLSETKTNFMFSVIFVGCRELLIFKKAIVVNKAKDKNTIFSDEHYVFLFNKICRVSFNISFKMYHVFGSKHDSIKAQKYSYSNI